MEIHVAPAHTYIHAYMHICIHVYIAYIHAYMQTCMVWSFSCRSQESVRNLEKVHYTIIQPPKTTDSFWHALYWSQDADRIRQVRTAYGWPVELGVRKQELENVQALRLEFLDRLAAFRTQNQNLCADMHAKLVSLEHGLRNGQQMKVDDLWLVGHLLQMRIRCAMGLLMHCEVKAVPSSMGVQIHQDGTYGPADRPVKLRVYHSAAFTDEAKRIAQYDLLIQDDAGCTLLAPEIDIEHETGPAIFPPPLEQDQKLDLVSNSFPRQPSQGQEGMKHPLRLPQKKKLHMEISRHTDRHTYIKIHPGMWTGISIIFFCKL